MSPQAFRRDPFLRTSGYDLLGWAPLNCLLSLPAVMAEARRPWSVSAIGVFTASMVVLGLGFMWTNRRRAAKLMGAADRDSAVNAPAIWLVAITAGVVATTVLVRAGILHMVLPAWMLAIGGAYVVWGRQSITELSIFGVSAVAAGILAVTLQSVQNSPVSAIVTLLLWNATMGVVAGVTAVIINRRYAWRLARCRYPAASRVQPHHKITASRTTVSP